MYRYCNSISEAMCNLQFCAPPHTAFLHQHHNNLLQKNNPAGVWWNTVVVVIQYMSVWSCIFLETVLCLDITNKCGLLISCLKNSHFQNDHLTEKLKEGKPNLKMPFFLLAVSKYSALCWIKSLLQNEIACFFYHTLTLVHMEWWQLILMC